MQLLRSGRTWLDARLERVYQCSIRVRRAVRAIMACAERARHRTPRACPGVGRLLSIGVECSDCDHLRPGRDLERDANCATYGPPDLNDGPDRHGDDDAGATPLHPLRHR